MLPIRSDPPRIDLVSAGSPAERGANQGAVLKCLLHDSSRAVLTLEAFLKHKPWWLPRPFYVRLADRRAEQSLRPALVESGSAHWERLAAMSVASGVPLGRVALLNAMEPVLSNITGSVASGAEAACSAIGISSARSRESGAIIAHNIDYLPLVQQFYVLRDERAAPGRLRSLQFSIAPLSGTIDGINEAGLAVTYNYGYATDRAVPAPTISMRLADVLAECRSVDEAVQSLTKRSRWGAGLIMLADVTGAVASLELTGTRHALRSSGDAGVVAHTNGFHCESTCDVEIPRTARHSRRAPAALRGRRVHQSTELRDARFAELCAEIPRFNLTDVSRVMSDHGTTSEASPDTICMHSDYWHTTACIQLLPAQRRLRVKYAPACAGEFAEFCL
jgi:hypothetical protein